MGEDGQNIAAEIFRLTAPVKMIESGRRPDQNEFRLLLIGRLGLAVAAKKLAIESEKLSPRFDLDA